MDHLKRKQLVVAILLTDGFVPAELMERFDATEEEVYADSDGRVEAKGV